ALPAERVELAEARFDRRSPLVTRVSGETPLDPSGQNDAVGECLTELGREREAVLVIDRVLVLAYQHGPLRPTLDHLTPLRNPGRPPVDTRRGLRWAGRCGVSYRTLTAK